MTWIPKVHALLERGRDCYKAAAEMLVLAMQEHSLNQKEAGEALGKSETWVSRLLKWYKADCPDGGVFGPERHRRKIATSQLYRAAEHTGQLELGLSDFGRNFGNYRSGQREASLRAEALAKLCAEVTRHAEALGCPETLGLVLASATAAERRHVLLALLRGAKKAATNLSALMHQIDAELKRISAPKSSQPLQPAVQALQPVLLH
jgi:hypothetical protein